MQNFDNYDRNEEPILQNEMFCMSGGNVVRIQVKESSYRITFCLDTDMYKNLRFNTFKRGVRISSILKKFPRNKKSKKIIITKDLTELSQLTEDKIIDENKYYNICIVVRLNDFIRSDVRRACERRILHPEQVFAE